VLGSVRPGEFKLIRPHMVPYYRNVYDGLFQISELAKGYTDYAQGILQVYLSMPPTHRRSRQGLDAYHHSIHAGHIIASWYGMNFKNDMHELDWQHGYAFAFCPDRRDDLGHVLVSAKRTGFSVMPAPKSSFLDKVLGRIGRLDKEGLQTVVQRLARERSFLETLFKYHRRRRARRGREWPHHLFQPGRDPAACCNPTQKVSNSINPASGGLGKNLPLRSAGGQHFVRHEFEVQSSGPLYSALRAPLME